VTDVGHKFSLILSREITDNESVTLKEAGCTEAVFGADSHPTNPDLTVAKMDFDDTCSPSLAEAIESALEAVKTVPDLSVPGLTVPAQPVEDSPGQTVTAEVVSSEVMATGEAGEAGAPVAEEATPEPVAEAAAHS
jgi:hypothetical protein